MWKMDLMCLGQLFPLGCQWHKFCHQTVTAWYHDDVCVPVFLWPRRCFCLVISCQLLYFRLIVLTEVPFFSLVSLELIICFYFYYISKQKSCDISMTQSLPSTMAMLALQRNVTSVICTPSSTVRWHIANVAYTCCVGGCSPYTADTCLLSGKRLFLHSTTLQCHNSLCSTHIERDFVVL